MGTEKRVSHPKEVLAIGQEVSVQLQEMDLTGLLPRSRVENVGGFSLSDPFPERVSHPKEVLAIGQEVSVGRPWTWTPSSLALPRGYSPLGRLLF